MVSDTGKRWIEAAAVLSKDPTASVFCPECGERNLTVQDIPLEWVGPKALEIEWDTPHIDRLIQCPACGSHNYILMRKLDG
jgi:DNA-directed RNA polymerase subunit RPC12/RpoP